LKNDPKITPPPGWQVGEATLVHGTPYFDLCSRKVRTPSNYEGDFFFMRSADWVKTIPVTANNEIVFIRQFRPHVGVISLEVPGGTMERDESNALDAAVRELTEETGYTSSRIEELGVIYPNPAIFSNRCHIYVAYDAEPTAKRQLDASEDMVTELIPVSEVKELLLEGKITHSLVAAALSLYLLKSTK